jgi:predicted transcriptional regulator
MKNTVRELVSRLGPLGASSQQPSSESLRKLWSLGLEEAIMELLESNPEGLSQTDISVRTGLRRHNGHQFRVILEKMVEDGWLISERVPNERHSRRLPITRYRINKKEESEEPMNISGLTALQKRAIEALRSLEQAGQKPTIHVIADDMGVNWRTIQRPVNALVDRGLLERSENRTYKLASSETEKEAEKPKIEVPEESYLGNDEEQVRSNEEPEKEEENRKKVMDERNSEEDRIQKATEARHIPFYSNPDRQKSMKHHTETGTKIAGYKEKMIAKIHYTPSIDTEKLAAALEVVEEMNTCRNALEKAYLIAQLMEAV